MNGKNLSAALGWLRFHAFHRPHTVIDEPRPSVPGPVGVQLTSKAIAPDDPVQNMSAQQLAVAVHERRRAGLGS